MMSRRPNVSFAGPWNEQTEEYDPVIRVAAAEYRYDGGRERYLVRPRDPNAGFAVLPGAQWRDYDGDEAYADYAMTLDPQTEVVSPVQTAAYLPGVGFWNAAANEPQYVHGDQVGTARLLTGPSAAVRARTVMTAFGEPIQASGTGVPPVGTRYGYAGSWGYEEAECRVIDLNGPEPGGETTWCDPLAELGWLHVGHRYYDPSSGRFVQRDPIGIDGGTNVYAYLDSQVVGDVDPVGLQPRTIPTVRTPYYPADCGPRIRVPDSPESASVQILGEIKWYDAPLATLASALGMPYNVCRMPPKPPGALWYCASCRAWQTSPIPHLHANWH